MSTSITAPAPSRKRKRGRYSYSKCKNCRKDKKKCEPIERPTDQPCHRCQEKGLQCSPHEDIRKNDTAPAPSLSDNNYVIAPDLKDPLIQCQHLYSWYSMIPYDTPIQKEFRPALLDVFSKTWKNLTNSDFKGKAVLQYLTREIDNGEEAWEGDLIHVFLGSVKQSGSYYTTRLELSRTIWDAGDTFNSIETLRKLLSTDWSKESFEDPGEVLTLQIVRQYFCFLKRFWDINRQLLKIHHAQLASLAPQLQRCLEIQCHLDLARMPSTVFDLILDEEPAYCTSTDAYGNTLLHGVTKMCFSSAPPSDLLQNVQKLLDRGIDVNQKNHSGQTALHVLCGIWSTTSDYIPFLKLMIQQKEIDINARNEYGETALHLLCKIFPGERKVRFLKLMIQHKEIDINAQNKHGETTLHLLCKRCSENNVSMNILELVLEHKDIDVGIRNEKGRIPADCLPQETTANLLEKHPFLRRLFPSSSPDDHP